MYEINLPPPKDFFRATQDYFSNISRRKMNLFFLEERPLIKSTVWILFSDFFFITLDSPGEHQKKFPCVKKQKYAVLGENF